MRCSTSAAPKHKEDIMAESKLSLENILDEYSPDKDEAGSPHVARADAQKVINSPLPAPVKEAPAP